MRSQLKRRRSLTPWLIVVFVLVLFCIFGLRGPSTSSDRVNVVVATSPMSVWSWNTTDNTFIVLTIPSDDVIDALYGYGNYSLDALWRLGFIDQKEGVLLSDSLSDTLGIPISWYIGAKAQTLAGVSDALGYGKTLFSLSNIFPFMGRRYQSNMPISLFIAFSRVLTAARPDTIHEIDVGNLDVVNAELLPDGTTRKVLSPDFLDHALGGIFESDVIRAEGLTVALYNTTSVPALGNRASRLLSNAGILVVTVGNDQHLINQCELTGGAKPLSSKTALYITSLFHCRKIVSQDGARADLMIRLGTDFAKRFEAATK